MKQTTMLVSDLLGKLAPYNPNRMDAEDVKDLGRFMNYAGVLQPIVSNERTQTVVGGEHRIRAASGEGMESLPVWVIDVDEPTEKIINVGLNKRHGRFDHDPLAQLMKDIDATGVDVTLTGFAVDEVAAMVQALEAEGPEKPEAGEDSGPIPVVAYSIIFDTELQQQTWYGFIRALKDVYPDAHSIGERLALHIKAWSASRA